MNARIHHLPCRRIPAPAVEVRVAPNLVSHGPFKLAIRDLLVFFIVAIVMAVSAYAAFAIGVDDGLRMPRKDRASNLTQFVEVIP